MRPAMLCLLLLPLASSLPAGTPEVKQWTRDALDKQFEEVDKRLKSLERQARPVERRVADLEEHVRNLRLKADQLDAQVKRLDDIAQTLRKEVASLAARVEALEARASGTPPVPAPAKGTPIPAGIAAIRSQKVAMDAQSFTITGTVANTSDKPLVFVIVQAELLDKDGKAFKTESAYTEPRIIPGGSSATFTIKAPRDPRMQDHRLSIRSE